MPTTHNLTLGHRGSIIALLLTTLLHRTLRDNGNSYPLLKVSATNNLNGHLSRAPDGHG
jgi:hypothetical protein